MQFFANAGNETIGYRPLFMYDLNLSNIISLLIKKKIYAICLDEIKKPWYSEYMPIFPHV